MLSSSVLSLIELEEAISDQIRQTNGTKKRLRIDVCTVAVMSYMADMSSDVM